MASINFYGDDVKPPAFKRRPLKKFITECFINEGKQLNELNYIFCSDERLLEINRNFLNHDYYTDIITFDLSDVPEKIKGEIYISLDRVNDHAAKYGESNELFRVIFHGVLHLCGYKDKKKSEITVMRQKEAEYMRNYGL